MVAKDPVMRLQCVTRGGQTYASQRTGLNWHSYHSVVPFNPGPDLSSATAIYTSRGRNFSASSNIPPGIISDEAFRFI